jgi:hypothetical protein
VVPVINAASSPEPDDGVGDFVRLTDPPQRHGSGGGLLCLLSGAAQVVGEDRAGGDDVDADVVCGVVEGGDLGDAFEPVLGGDVGGEPTDALQTGRGGHVDDGTAAVLDHGWQFVLHG